MQELEELRDMSEELEENQQIIEKKLRSETCAWALPLFIFYLFNICLFCFALSLLFFVIDFVFICFVFFLYKSVFMRRNSALYVLTPYSIYLFFAFSFGSYIPLSLIFP